MRNTNKKGFTIVELVIVVAVIAILAAVMIPTFSGIIAKAQLSADQKAERDMNTALAIESNPKDIDAAIDALIANGFNGKNLVPVSKDYSYVWSNTDYKIYLVKTNEITADQFNLANGVKYIDVVAKDAADVVAAINNGSEYIKLENDVTIKTGITLPANSNITIDLNGKSINASAVQGRPFELTSNSTLTINAKDSVVDCGLYGLVNILAGAENANVIINGGTFTSDTDNGAIIKIRGNAVANVTLNNVKMIDTYTKYTTKDNYLIHNQGGTLTLTVNGGEFTGNVGFVGVNNATIKNAKFTTDGYAIYAINGAITDCTFNIGNYTTRDGQGVDASAVATSSNGKVIVSNSKIDTESVAFDVLTSGGTIEVSNCTVDGVACRERAASTLNKGCTSTIEIDGQVAYTATSTK